MEFLAHVRKTRREALRQRAQILMASMVYTPVYHIALRIRLVNDTLPLHWTPPIREWAAAHNVELVATDYAGHHEVAVAFRRYLRRRSTDHQNSRIRLLESRSRVA